MIRRSRGKALILMYYDTVVSKVEKDMKGKVVTFNLRPVLKLNFMRLDPVPCSRNGKERIKS